MWRFKHPSRFQDLHRRGRARALQALCDLGPPTCLILFVTTAYWEGHPQQNNESYRELVATWAFASTCGCYSNTACKFFPSLQNHPCWAFGFEWRSARISTASIYKLKPKFEECVDPGTGGNYSKTHSGSQSWRLIVTTMAIFTIYGFCWHFPDWWWQQASSEVFVYQNPGPTTTVMSRHSQGPRAGCQKTCPPHRLFATQSDGQGDPLPQRNISTKTATDSWQSLTNATLPPAVEQLAIIAHQGVATQLSRYS